MGSRPGSGLLIPVRVNRRIQLVLAVLLAAAVAIVLVAPSYDLLPTTLGNESAAHVAVVAVGILLLPAVIAVRLAAQVAGGLTPSPDVVALTCVRIC